MEEKIMNRRYNAEEKRRIIQYRRKGCTIAEIAEYLGRTEKAIGAFLYRNGLQLSSEERRNQCMIGLKHKAVLDRHMSGSLNPNWKGGRAEVTKRYKIKEKGLYPERAKAISIVNGALRSGKLKRLPCMLCGAHKTEAHHEDYSKPLDVIFLCKKHHDELHHKLRGWK